MEHREWGRDMSQEEEKFVANSLENVEMATFVSDERSGFEGVKKKDLVSREKTIKQFEDKLIREIDRAQIFEESLEGVGIDIVKTKLKQRAEQLNYQYNDKASSDNSFYLDAEDEAVEYKELIVVNDFLGRIKMMEDPSFDFKTRGSDSTKLARTPSGLN